MLVVPEELLDQIHVHGEEAYPDEGAGFLIGDEGKVKRSFCLWQIRVKTRPATTVFVHA